MGRGIKSNRVQETLWWSVGGRCHSFCQTESLPLASLNEKPVSPWCVASLSLVAIVLPAGPSWSFTRHYVDLAATDSKPLVSEHLFCVRFSLSPKGPQRLKPTQEAEVRF